MALFEFGLIECRNIWQWVDTETCIQDTNQNHYFCLDNSGHILTLFPTTKQMQISKQNVEIIFKKSYLTNIDVGVIKLQSEIQVIKGAP